MKINSITKLLSVIKENEIIRACEIGQRVADKYHDGVLPKPVSDAIRNALPTMYRKGYITKTLVGKLYYYGRSQNSHLYVERPHTKCRTEVRQVGCYQGDKLLCSKSVNFKSQIVKFEEACIDHFGNVTFTYYYDKNEILNVPMPTKNQKNMTPQKQQKKSLVWFENKTLGSLETLSKQLNTPLPKTKEQIVEFYNKAIAL